MYHNRSGRHSRIAWPRIVASSARYMGLRTYRYRPPTTRCAGGATGAGVPSPSTTNRANADTSMAVPATTSTAPGTRGKDEEDRASGRGSGALHGCHPFAARWGRMVGALQPVDRGLQRWAVEAAGGQGGRQPVSHDAGRVDEHDATVLKEQGPVQSRRQVRLGAVGGHDGDPVAQDAPDPGGVRRRAGYHHDWMQTGQVPVRMKYTATARAWPRRSARVTRVPAASSRGGIGARSGRA